MDLLIDTNVIINVLTDREDTYKSECEPILQLCNHNLVRGFIAFHCLPTIWYVLRNYHNRDETRTLIRFVCGIVTVVSASHSQVLEAVENRDFHDFEDCLQDICAQNAGAQYIVTCNNKDFRNAETRAVTPVEMLEILRQSEGQL